MKKLLALAAAVATLAVAAPANASPFDNVNAKQAQIERSIDFGARSGRLTRNEVFNLRAQLRNISFLERQYRRGGLSFGERADLNRRLDRLSFQVQAQANDRDHRGRDHRRWG